ncbi:hypothetical protein [Actinacidiphila acididurans]|uniref:Integral membrane protein n=1 Tax=Actinacidiphila acididurans TaxID=2784346 RepID=A0ABS2U5U5_9ACTN|nr:hypothetical protein [Actinacidiphila acididurans]MBM9509528.1 hypothetical protein [Actinacidiphila acididurans]
MGGQVRITTSAVELPGGVVVRFMRTLRLPETGTHPLPPGLGTFPLRRVQDYPDRVPAQWLAHGGVLLPVYQREAMWLSFSAPRPAALQVGAGKVCAVSGKPWSDRLSRDPQNYLVLPRQPWLDGINSGQGTIRQFVAVPLGLGATVEGQVSGEEVWGGVQLQVFELGEQALGRWQAAERERERAFLPPPEPMASGAPGGPVPTAAAVPAPRLTRAAPAMGLGAGGRMRQEVYRDERPLTDWRAEPSGRIFVHLATAPQWQDITGEPAPSSPVDRAAYTTAGLPWYDYYDADAADLPAADPLADVKPVGDWLGDDQTPWVPPGPHQVQHLGDDDPGRVSDGEW